MLNEKGFIKYIVIIIVILGVAFLSQRPHAAEYVKNLYLQAEAKISGWAGSFFVKKQAGETLGGGGAVYDEQNNQNENNIFENSFLKK